MHKRGVVVLTGSSEVLKAVGAMYRGARPRVVACLASIRAPGEGAVVVIDPRALNPCCLRALGRWSRTRRARRVVYLALPAPPDVLLGLVALHPGSVRALGHERDAVVRPGPRPPARAAWAERRRLLDWQPQDERQRRFLALARGSASFGRPETEIAAALGIGTRHLSRLVQGWFGYTPKVVLDLFRLDRAAREVEAGRALLQQIAVAYGYGSRRALTRQCRAFTGLPPSTFRRLAPGARAAMSEDGPSVSRIGGFSRPPAGGIQTGK